MEFLFLGLGNIEEYRGTRHNIGKDLVEALAQQAGATWKEVGKAEIATLLLGPHVITCTVSKGYMNTTGEDLQEILAEIDPQKLLVLHDELDLKVGLVRLSYNKSPGGHNGVASVAKQLGTNAFSRLRIGVGRGENVKKYVLEVIPPQDLKNITKALHEKLPDIISELFIEKNKTRQHAEKKA